MLKRGPYKTRLPLGTLILVKICGDGGDSLLAKVVKNKVATIVEVIQPHPVYQGVRLSPKDYRVERRESA